MKCLSHIDFLQLVCNSARIYKRIILLNPNVYDVITVYEPLSIYCSIVI